MGHRAGHAAHAPIRPLGRPRGMASDPSPPAAAAAAPYAAGARDLAEAALGALRPELERHGARLLERPRVEHVDARAVARLGDGLAHHEPRSGAIEGDAAARARQRLHGEEGAAWAGAAEPPEPHVVVAADGRESQSARMRGKGVRMAAARVRALQRLWWLLRPA